MYSYIANGLNLLERCHLQTNYIFENIHYRGGVTSLLKDRIFVSSVYTIEPDKVSVCELYSEWARNEFRTGHRQP